LAHTLRSVSRLTGAIVVAGTVGFAQVPAPTPRIAGQRVDVPPLSERINIRPVTEGPGAFSKPRAARTSRVFGAVINELGFIVPSAGLVVLRSLEDGNIVAQTEVDAFGQFNVPQIAPGLYTADLVDDRGAVLTSSPSFTVGLDEVVQITPVVSQRTDGGLGALLRSGTAGVLYAASSAGVLAIQTPAPISP
jgi:hypothetical protein